MTTSVTGVIVRKRTKFMRKANSKYLGYKYIQSPN